jgi:hypothetical protein
MPVSVHSWRNLPFLDAFFIKETRWNHDNSPRNNVSGSPPPQ